MYNAITILLVIILTFMFWSVIAYNSLATLRHHVKNAWQQIDVQLKRRADLIPNLVSTVKGAMQFEKETLAAVVEARAMAVGAKTVGQRAAAEGALSAALGRLFAVVESYPDLKSNKNILQLQEELTSTENRIGFARQLYNDLVRQFNTRQTLFPTLIIASLLGFKQAEYFQAEAGDKAVPKVDLGPR